MTIELLYFDGCPSHESLLPRLRMLLDREGLGADVKLRRVESVEEAEQERFLGSPSVRVDGRDIEPGAEERDDFGIKCRLYRADGGLAGVPPDEWVVAALRMQQPADETRPPSTAEVALSAIGIAPELFAERRAAGLAAEDRDLYRAILVRLASGGPATRSWLARGADQEIIDRRLRRLAGADLIGLDGDGGVALAYPISVHPSRQRVDLADGCQLWACCAIDALGIPAMVGMDATVVGRDPDRETEIRVALGPDGDPSAEPPDAVVLAAGVGNGTTACCACPFINFFPSSASAEAYQVAHPELDGSQLSVEEATVAGRVLFGGLLERLAG